MPEPKTVGVIGGLGPEATLDFFGRVLAATGAETDQDHIRLLIDNNPRVPNRNEGIFGTGPSPGPTLAAMARGLEAQGADVLVMPCNAAHAYLSDIVAAVGVPLLSIIDATVAAVARICPDARRVGILASSGCLAAELYQRALHDAGIEPIAPEPDAIELFMELLAVIKRGGKDTPGVHDGMRGLADRQIGRGAEAIIAGCTEIPLVLAPGDLACPLVSSTDALVALTVATALARALG